MTLPAEAVLLVKACNYKAKLERKEVDLMGRRIVAALWALLALAAIAAVPASALAKNTPLVVENGTPVATGSKFLMTNFGSFEIQSSIGILYCSTAILTGTLTSNTTGSIEGNITSVKLGGTGALQVGAAEPECTGSLLGETNTTVTTNPATNGLPWCIRSTGAMQTDEFQIRGNECAKVARAIRFALDITGIGTCTYERGVGEPVPGTFTTSTVSSSLSISGVSFWAVAGNPFGCPSSVKLQASLTLETDAAPFTSLGISS